MADPVSGGIGKASQQMMQELQRQMQEVQSQQVEKPESNFGDMVSQKVDAAQDPSKVQNTQKVNETQKATDVLRTAVAQGPAPTGATDPSKAVNSSQATKGIRKLLGQVVEGQNKLDDIIKMATSGKTYGHQDLLAIQASVYKFSQEMELTSKVVEKATSGVKQTMQTQV